MPVRPVSRPTSPESVHLEPTPEADTLAAWITTEKQKHPEWAGMAEAKWKDWAKRQRKAARKSRLLAGPQTARSSTTGKSLTLSNRASGASIRVMLLDEQGHVLDSVYRLLVQMKSAQQQQVPNLIDEALALLS